MMSDRSIADKACQAMHAIFRPKAGQSVESYFSENLIQHDPHMRDGLAGLKEFVDEVAQSRHGDVTIHRTLIDGDLVAIHSKCHGLKGFSGPMIAFDIFRFDGGKIAEHWRGSEPEAPPILPAARRSTARPKYRNVTGQKRTAPSCGITEKP
jgi:predicted SnoaL-like aldol condensation-catalyzing enzyme